MSHDSTEKHENITVAIRCRPVPASAANACIVSSANRSVTLTEVSSSMEKKTYIDMEASKQVLGKTYQFDAVFDETCSTRRIYDQVVHKIVQSSLKGINGTVLAAGSTNTGKTHTIIGGGGSLGIVTMALMDIFAARSHHRTTHTYNLSATMVEIYNEQIIDLLTDDPTAPPVQVVVNSHALAVPCHRVIGGRDCSDADHDRVCTVAFTIKHKHVHCTRRRIPRLKRCSYIQSHK